MMSRSLLALTSEKFRLGQRTRYSFTQCHFAFTSILFGQRILARISSRWEVSPPQLPPSFLRALSSTWLPWDDTSSLLQEVWVAGVCVAAGLMAALASARWPLPIEKPLNALTSLPRS